MPLQVVQARGQVTLTRELRRKAGIRAGDVVLTRVTAPGTVEVTRLPTLTLSDLIARFRIKGPVEEATDREQWQGAAARDVIGEASD